MFKPTSSRYCLLRIVISLLVSPLLADITCYYRRQPNTIIVSLAISSLLACFARYISSSDSCVSSNPLDMNQEINHTIYFNEDVKKMLLKLSKYISIHATLKKNERLLYFIDVF